MFIDTSKESLDTALETEVAIIGSGPAGLTLARRLADAGVDVVILESGGLDYSPQAQDFNDGSDLAERANYLLTSRIRAFGGTSFHWGGWCRPLDPLDFSHRPWVADSGWPIAHETLVPYYREAARICDLDDERFDQAHWVATRGQQPLGFADGRFASSYFQLSPPVRFGQKYRQEARRSERLTVVLGATVTRIALDPDATRCVGLDAMLANGKPLTVRARTYVVACGGVENARLLLLSNDVMADGVGNQYGLVGRYFMDHPAFNAGQVVPLDAALDIDYYRYDALEGIRGFGTLVPTPQLQEALRSPTFNIELVGEWEGPLHHREEMKQNYWALYWRFKDGTLFDEVGDSLSQFWTLFGNGAAYAWESATSRGVKLRSIVLRHHLEATPNAQSRVVLDSSRRDANGQPRARLEWRVNRSDAEGWLRAQEALARSIGASEIGRMQLGEAGISELAEMLPTMSSWHHIGTTRMADDPRHGVTNADGRVHGCANLYVAGSSLFPTCGHANPTLTIVALALRQADHLIAQRASHG